MTAPAPGGYVSPETVARLDRAIAELATALTKALDRIGELERAKVDLEDEDGRQQRILREHGDAINGLVRAVSPAPPRDDLNDRIVAFLDEHVGLKFSAVSIAENIGEANKRIAERCSTLAGQGRIKRQQEANRHPLYTSRKRVPQ